MTNSRSFILKALSSIGAMLALSACIDPVIIGGNGDGGNGGNGGTGVVCMSAADCAPGQSCVNGVCSGGSGMTCNGMASPLSCTQTGCAAGEICEPDTNPNACYPSSCGCDAATGTWVCTADCGQGSHCVAQGCVPSPETCNAVDDDCDGAIDEQDDPALPLCMDGTACVMGQCGGGPIVCMSDAECPPNQLCKNGICSGGTTCTTEICNGVDDDCNGVVDDGAGAVCADGTVCVNGQCNGNPMQCGPNNPCPMGQICTPNGVCSPGGCVPKPETCNGIDDNCNGVVDDATAGTTLCPNGGQCLMGQCGGVIQCGPNNPCPMGQVCSAMGVCSPGGCVPKPETCNGVDDDCDGAIDEATPGAILCPNGGQCVMGQCSGVPQMCGPNTPCPAGQICNPNGVCSPGGCMPVPETCNGKDDDCDGIVDDASAGTTLCPNGFCFGGACTMQCSSNANCPAGQVCVNGLCK
jgi:hypothetical protein